MVRDSPDLDALRARASAELGKAAVPATITVIDTIPTTPSGKPDTRVLIPPTPPIPRN